MRKYDFEFNDNKFAMRLFVICFILFLVLLFLNIILKFNFLISITVSLSIPILIFWFNRKKILKKGFAIMNESEVKFNLNGIKNYQIQIYNGTALNIKLKSSKRIGIVSNFYFCNPIQFDIFCKEFENKIEKYKAENNVELTRKKSFFEQVWIFPFLVIVTSILIILVLIAIFKGMELKPSFLIPLAPLMTLWGGYCSARNREKK